MPVVYSVTARSNRLTAVQTLIDAGSTNAVMRLLSASGSVLSSLKLPKPSSVVSSGVMSFLQPITDGSAAASGTATAARIEDSEGNTIVSGLTVGSSGGTDVVLSPTSDIVVGQAISIQTGTIIGS